MARRPPSLFLKLALRLTGVTVVLIAALLAVLVWRLDSVIEHNVTLLRDLRVVGHPGADGLVIGRFSTAAGITRGH